MENEILQTKIARIGWFWAAVTALMGCIGTIIHLIVAYNSDASNILIFLISLLAIPILLAGIGQVTMLLELFHRGNVLFTIWATLAGLLIYIPYILFYAFSFENSNVTSLTPSSPIFWEITLLFGAGVTIIGAIVGFSQALVIRTQRKQALVWILTTALSWGVSWSLGLQGVGAITTALYSSIYHIEPVEFAMYFHSRGDIISPLIAGYAGLFSVWIFLGITTSLALRWLLKYERQAVISAR